MRTLAAFFLGRNRTAAASDRGRQNSVLLRDAVPERYHSSPAATVLMPSAPSIAVD